MLQLLMVDPSVVEARRFFLQELNHPAILMSLRVIGIVLFVVSILVYVYMKGKRGK